MKKFLFVLSLFFSAHAFACDVGYYMNDNNQCTLCRADGYYCPGDDVMYPCPDPQDFYDAAAAAEPDLATINYDLVSWDQTQGIRSCRARPVLYTTTNGAYFYSQTYTGSSYPFQDRKYWILAPIGYYMSNYYTSNIYYGITACTNAPTNAHYTAAGTPEVGNCPWTCDDGYYGSSAAGSNSCTLCEAGNSCAGGVRTACQKGYYSDTTGVTACTVCPGATYSDTVGATSCTACPVADASTAYTTYPDDFYNPTLVRFNHQTWSTGLKSIEACVANYWFTNTRGSFIAGAVHYNATSGKYDGGIDHIYYTSINAGYYGDTKYGSTYCDVETRNMYYQYALPCPPDSYCPGLASMPLCSSGTYNDTIGINACPAGLYSPAGMWESAQCGHILHVGDDVVYLRATKKTSPSVHVKIGNDIFYGNMTTADVPMNSGTAHKLKLNYGGTTYSVYDDTVNVN